MTDTDPTPAVEAPRPDQPPKDSYRALLQLRANGEPVSDFELRLWREEEEVIRSAFYAPQSFRDCGLQPAHMAAPVHGLAWQAFQQILEDSPKLDKLDAAVLLSEMRKLDEGRLAGVRGVNWIKALLSEAPIRAADVIQRHIKDIRTHYRNRRVKRRYDDLGRRVTSDPDIAGVQADYLRVAHELTFQVAGEGFIEDPIDQVEWDARTKDLGALVKLGLPEIDRASGGLGRGNMLVWGGGTGHGKSYVAGKILRAQPHLGQRALYIGVEDPKELMLCRLYASYCEPTQEPKEILKREADADVVEDAIARMRSEFQGRVWAVERKKATVSQVCQLIHNYRHTCDVDLVIVDYLQAISGDDDTPNKVQEVSRNVSMLKRCCTVCQVALVVFSQYARDSYKDGSEPTITSYKYAGDIENETEVAVVMWKDPSDRLLVKVPKLKWARTRDLRWEILVDPVSGWHLDWRDDFAADAATDDR